MTETRLKGLDGIRALCALVILWGHMAQRDFSSWGLSLFPLPECCAYVFFVISGFLAGFRLDGFSSSKVYYKKKAIRILPLYYFYILLTVLVFCILGRGSEVLNARLFFYLLLVPNIPFAASEGILPLVHLWFIGTLTLFYLIVPLFSKIKDERKSSIALIIASSWFIIKLLLKLYGGGYLYRLVGCTSFDILFFGVWGGLKMREGFSLSSISIFLLSLAAWGLFLLSGVYGRYIPAPIKTEYIAALALIIILMEQKQAICILLENRVACFLSSISYEIYVGHILVIILLSDLYVCLGRHVSGWIIYLMATLVVVFFAYVLKIGIRFVVPAK